MPGTRFSLPVARIAAVALAVVAGIVLAVVLLGGGGGRGGDRTFLERSPQASGGEAPKRLNDVRGFDPLAYEPGRDREFLERGRDGLAHPLFALSPGGVPATVERVARFEEPIAAAADRHGVRRDTLGALVFLESGGRPEVAAGGDPAGAVGLGQILPETATSLLGMSVDLPASKRLTRRIERDRRRTAGAPTKRRRDAAARRVRTAERRRRMVDERYDPRRALDGAARYLAIAERRFGREDLAAVSYHMGIGNLESVIAAYVSPRPLRRTTRATVKQYDISYPRLYFDSEPRRNGDTFRRLLGLGDDSRHYLFRLEAAREIRRLADEDPGELETLVRRQAAKASAEEVLRPRPDNEPFAGGGDLRGAYDDGDLLPLPAEPVRLGYRIDPDMGELARGLEEPVRLYRGLRPEALATLLFMTKEVKRLSGRSRLRVTSTVRDLRYQRRLIGRNAEATRGFSLHTTGYAIDIRRGTGRPAERRALQHVLERLRALGVIDWVVEPAAIHFTVGPDGERYEDLLETLTPELP